MSNIAVDAASGPVWRGDDIRRFVQSIWEEMHFALLSITKLGPPIGQPNVFAASLPAGSCSPDHMDGQGDGWHNGPSIYHIPLLIGNRPPNDDPNMEYVVVLDYVVNQEVIFVNEGEPWPDDDDVDDDVDVIVDDQPEAAVGAEVEIGDAASAEEDDGDPRPPGSSRKSCKGDQEGGGGGGGGGFRWWDELDGDSSDGGGGEQDVEGPPRSRRGPTCTS